MKLVEAQKLDPLIYKHWKYIDLLKEKGVLKVSDFKLSQPQTNRIMSILSGFEDVKKVIGVRGRESFVVFRGTLPDLFDVAMTLLNPKTDIFADNWTAEKRCLLVKLSRGKYRIVNNKLIQKTI